MSTRLGFLALTLTAFAACATESDPGPVVVTSTTSANAVADGAAVKIARARCRRAAECDRIGAGQMYLDKDDCATRERNAAVSVAATCSNGVSGDRLDGCLNSLENQACDSNMGPVTTMPGCHSYLPIEELLMGLFSAHQDGAPEVMTMSDTTQAKPPVYDTHGAHALFNAARAHTDLAFLVEAKRGPPLLSCTMFWRRPRRRGSLVTIWGTLPTTTSTPSKRPKPTSYASRRTRTESQSLTCG